MPKYVHTTDIHNTRSSDVIIPWILQYLDSKSVVDIGCGTGTWLKTFEKLGVKDIYGFEGFHLKKEVLVIPEDKVKLVNLEEPFKLDRKFDLAITLEVAEHLKESSADDFIDSICSLSDVILFSAAVPGQGGQNHINEQWPSYWKEKFEKRGYNFHDCIRGHFWNNSEIDWWYRQNIFLATKKGKEISIPQPKPLIDFVHPELFTPRSSELIEITRGLSGVSKAFKILIKNITSQIKGRTQ